MQREELVSIVMPAYNAGKYIKEAIDSVLLQEYTNWELLIIDDGSTDDTATCVKDYRDSRIKYHYQENAGVSAARNKALALMKGTYFCFLDADDAFYPKSLSARVALLEEDKNLFFVDGSVHIMNAELQKVEEHRIQDYEGNPFDALIRIDASCFFGPSWMVRRTQGHTYRMQEGMTHSEDLLFYISIAKQGKYIAIEEPILKYRRGHGSAMSNLEGLSRGYQQLFSILKRDYHLTGSAKRYLRWRLMRIMVLSFLGNRQFFKAVKAFFDFLFL